MELLKTVFDLTKFPAQVALALALLSGFLLFGGESLLPREVVAGVKKSHGWWLGAVFLTTTAYSLVSILWWLRKFLIGAWLEVLFGR